MNTREPVQATSHGAGNLAALLNERYAPDLPSRMTKAGAHSPAFTRMSLLGQCGLWHASILLTQTTITRSHGSSSRRLRWKH